MRVARPIKLAPQPKCDYCGADAVLKSAQDAGYPYRDERGAFWVCVPCGAWIGVNARSKMRLPLGRMANATLRQAKSELHDVLEPLVQAKMRRDRCNVYEARSKALRWIAESLGLSPKDRSIHRLNEVQCRQAIARVKSWLEERHARHGA
jgi:hypothetical protein